MENKNEKTNLSYVENQIKPLLKGPAFGVRHVQFILGFLLVTIGYSTKVSLSVAIVAMTDNTTSTNPNIPTYDWDNTSIILSSFFWGYIAFQLLAGHVAKKYGPKWFLFGAMFVNSSATAAVPFMASLFGSIGVMVCRVLQGLSQGFIFPCTHTILGKWAPVEERSWMGTVIYTGMSVGMIIATLVTGLISSSEFGWPAAFYLYSVFGFSWCVLWYFLGSNGPNVHPTITKDEKNYIQTSLDQHDEHEELQVPWKAILKSRAHWAIVVAHVGSSWGSSTLMTEVPTYLSKAMQFDMKSNSLITASPAVLGIFFGLFCGHFSDFLIVKRYVSTINVRRIFQSIAAFIPAIGLVFLSFVSKENPVLVIVLLNVAQVSQSAHLCGYGINHVDLSPRFSGILMGFSNGLAQVFSLMAPLFVQLIVTEQSDVLLWRIIFMTAAFVNIGSGTFYALFSSADRQWWDSKAEKDSQDKEKKVSTTEKY